MGVLQCLEGVPGFLRVVSPANDEWEGAQQKEYYVLGKSKRRIDLVTVEEASGRLR
jgi:hypothetical protein